MPTYSQEEPMKATVWKDTVSMAEGNIYGIRVGFRNRKACFPEDERWDSVEVEIGGAVHHFRLLDGFWRKCPDIRDDKNRTLRKWIQQYRSLTWERRKPPYVNLIREKGSRRFKLVS